MKILKITRKQFEVIMDCISEGACNDEAYIQEHGKEKAGKFNVISAIERRYLTKLFQVHDTCRGTNIT